MADLNVVPVLDPGTEQTPPKADVPQVQNNEADAVQVEVEGGKGGEGEKDDERGREEGGERRREETDGEDDEEERDNDQREEAAPEKLPDDDVMKEPFYLRAFFTVFPMLKRVEELRRLRANDPEYNKQYRYANNVVTTSKYNLITFLPLNLLEQFLRVANLYFLILLIIQVIPTVSSVPFYSTLLPLVFVLTVTAVKDAYDDIKRHISDFKINNRIAHVFQYGQLVEVKWKQVRVGNVIRLEKDDFVTADMLLLSSSEPNSLAYIETAELDGETNLKVREPLPETATLGEDVTKLSEFDGYVECEPPNNRLHKFVGTLTWNDKQYSIDNDKVLLRGCRLRNTHWMYGVVIYAGHDTKLVQNSGRTRFKRTRLDLHMNRLVLFILGFLAFLLTICLIGSGIFESVYGVPFSVYVQYTNEAQDTPAEIAFLQILSNLIVLNTFVPISLYVSVEVIRLGLSLLINWDRKMYYEPNDIPAISRTTTLNEELGQIEYIFSDKTGTLTQNIMTFLKCSIEGVKYGEAIPDDKDREVVVATGEVLQEKKPESPTSELPQVDFTSWNSYADPTFRFYDQSFLDKCRARDKQCDEFFKLLCLCHTVLPTMETGSLTYNAQSPDEAALVSAAKNFGYVFKARSPFSMTLDILNTKEEEEYEVLNILDFNNERKRMSVIVRYNDKITLYCKGADSVVFARLSGESSPLKKVTLDHLADYAREGLRTLVLAKKEISEEEYQEWAQEHHAASILQENRDQAVDLVYNKIEQGLTLMGATAIEDKLQDGVPETIANLAKANIKIWVLTGDKQETAINIGYSSKLLTEDMRVFIIDADDREGVIDQLNMAREEIESKEDNSIQQDEEGGERGDSGTIDETKLGPPFGIVLNGHSLRHALKDQVKMDLLETAGRCQAVICCRVTPLQKKRVVDLVKKNRDAVTLAIGDGANDVGMIKAAHIGVGISGQEGQQAVLASDFSFGQFRFLERLLLVHGRWSYHRMTSFLQYFFYKNFAFAFSQFLFAFFCGFTAQTLYDPFYIAIYNVVYTSLPVVALAILDQDVDEDNCYRFPRLYITGQQNKNFNSFIFVRSLIKGIYVAIVFFFVLFGMTLLNFYSGGYEWDYQSFGLAASGALTIIVNLQIALDTFFWNPIMHIFVWGSIIAWFVVIPITSTEAIYNITAFRFYPGTAFQVLASATFWFYLPLTIVVALLPTVALRVIRLEVYPHLVDDVRLKMKLEGKRLFKRLRQKSLLTRSTRSLKRTGYAFSHQEGFGRIIESGVGFRGMEPEQVEEERRQRFSTWMSSPPTSPAIKKTADEAKTAHEAETTPVTKVDLADTVSNANESSPSIVTEREVVVNIHSSSPAQSATEMDQGEKEDIKELVHAPVSIPGAVSPTDSPEARIPLQEKSGDYDGTNLQLNEDTEESTAV